MFFHPPNLGFLFRISNVYIGEGIMFKNLESRNNFKLRMTAVFVFKEMTTGLAMFNKIMSLQALLRNILNFIY